MFSLIITIISIALVVALVAATMYYGGDTLNQGRAQADAATLVSAAQQITGAVQMHVALEASQPADLAALVNADYLSSVPAALDGVFTLSTANKTLTAPVTSDDVCAILEADGGDVYGCVESVGTDTVFGTADDVAFVAGTSATRVFGFKY